MNNKSRFWRSSNLFFSITYTTEIERMNKQTYTKEYFRMFPSLVGAAATTTDRH